MQMMPGLLIASVIALNISFAGRGLAEGTPGIIDRPDAGPSKEINVKELKERSEALMKSIYPVYEHFSRESTSKTDLDRALFPKHLQADQNKNVRLVGKNMTTLTVEDVRGNARVAVDEMDRTGLNEIAETAVTPLKFIRRVDDRISVNGEPVEFILMPGRCYQVSAVDRDDGCYSYYIIWDLAPGDQTIHLNWTDPNSPYNIPLPSIRVPSGEY